MYAIALIGSMFSGKSSRSIELLSIYGSMGKSTSYITYTGDDRYENIVETHRGVFEGDKIDRCTKVSDLKSVLENEEIMSSQVICIDEAQFFTDLIEFIEAIKFRDIIIIISGLISDFKVSKFGQITDILHYCSEIEHMKSYCKICNEQGTLSHASFTARKGEDLELVLIGGKEDYYSVCHKHHRYMRS